MAGVTARLSLSVTTQGSVCWQQTPLDSNGGEGAGHLHLPVKGEGERWKQRRRLSEEEEECGENKKKEEEEEEEEEGPQQCSHGVVARGTSGRL